ncbi:hypothetical protein EDB92DRAFT_1947041 [Lactarius akahatsu]|uniref:F-box domain-containing protein n=1 Tax=Lactarius akahatsu TaxID=416441 RepID=A0AAD4QCS3_9AGAM|nr:hypothetical protein EDB92DRAFT_1947041 [Lactarius akahatsu]
MPGGRNFLPLPVGKSNKEPHPITLLLTEILSEIMCYCYLPFFFGHEAPSIHPLHHDIDPSGGFTKDGPVRTLHWVAVSHVCRRWREIALRCKALWTAVPLVSVSWAQRALTLSHPHPITLHIDSKDTSLDKGYVYVYVHLGARGMVTDVVFDALCRGAPKIEELDLAPDPPFLARSALDRSTAIEDDLAALRVIRLDHHVAGAGALAEHPFPLIPKLQVLELYGVLPTPQSSPDPAPTLDRPLLPLLQELHLGGTAQGVLAVLQVLELPERVRVYVGVPDVPTEDGSPSRLVTKLRGKQGSGPEPSHSSH